MILAAPLVIPFAKAVGLSVGTLGMAALADQVNDYIEANPEESMKILSTIIPGVGIGQIFMSKEDKISLEDLDEMTDEEAQDLSKEEKAELMKQAGKSGGGKKGKRQTMIDISEKLGLSGPGREKQDIEYEVDERYDEGGVEGAPRPKFDYTKFFRKRRADGGSIGIEVLFTEKKPRKNFNVGGSASAVDFAKALEKVGAGTAAQKRQSLSNYLGDLIATQGQKLGTAAVIPLQAAKGVLGIQGTPITDSMQASLQKIIQDKVSKTGKLKGGIDYRDYGVKTTTGKEFEGFGKRSITDPEAALATTLGQADYVVDPKTGKVTFTGGTAYDFRDDQFGGLGKFISKGGVFSDQATQYNPDITLGSDFMKQTRKPLSKEKFYEQFYQVPYDPYKTTYFAPTDKSDPNYYKITQADTYSKFKNLVDSGIVDIYTGPTDYKTYLKNFADGGRVGLFMGGPPLEGQALSIYNSMNAYGFTDQEIADTLSERGLRTPGGGGTETTAPNIIGSQLKSPSGGDNFSVFNPDPNRIKSFIPEKNVASPRTIQRNTALTKQGDYDIYGNKVKETLNPLQAGIRSVKNTMASVIDNPVFQTIGAVMNPAFTAVKGIASMAKNVLPVNPRAIAENFAGQQGIRVDDIGRIVNTGKYTDPNNVMAGYNLNAITQETFDDRIGNIAETLADKYGMTPTEIQAAMEGTYTGPVKTNLIETIRAVKLANTNIMNIKNKAIETARREQEIRDIARANKISRSEARGVRDAIDRQGRESAPGRGDAGNPGGSSGAMSDANAGTYCFDPNTLVQMADGSEKKIKEIQLGDQTKGGEVTGVFQFKASDEIHDYKGVTVAGSHYVKENGKFIMVQDSPISVKIDKIPVVYSLDTTGRRIFINDIEFADYNGDGVAKNFLTNAGVDLTGFDTEVLRQIENRLI